MCYCKPRFVLKTKLGHHRDFGSSYCSLTVVSQAFTTSATLHKPHMVIQRWLVVHADKLPWPHKTDERLWTFTLFFNATCVSLCYSLYHNYNFFSSASSLGGWNPFENLIHCQPCSTSTTFRPSIYDNWPHWSTRHLARFCNDPKGASS